MAEAYEKNEEAFFDACEERAAPLVAFILANCPEAQRKPADVLSLMGHACFNAVGKAMPEMDYEAGLQGIAMMMSHVVLSTAPAPDLKEATEIMSNIWRMSLRVYSVLLLNQAVDGKPNG